MSAAKHDFAKAAAKALDDRESRAILDRAIFHIDVLRQRSVKAMPDFAERRARAVAVREKTLARLPELLETLEARVTAAGGRVHYAEDAAQAAATVTDILTAAGAKLVVKGKSMVSEEIGLNDALAAAGIEAVETDLGEYIIQLAGQRPSHILAPALHVSKEQVSALFQEKLGRTSADIPEMTRIARDSLREKFLAADAGITGCNIAVARTGTVTVLENEGNIRFSASCPPVHVALMTLEKVVETLADAAAILDILPPSATGQTLPVHLSFFTGARRDGERDGPREMHLVVVDNGRSAVLADPVLRDILRCIRCGACLNVCPVYQAVGGHAYGSVYPGPMGSVLSSVLAGGEGDPRQPFACTHCAACAGACPAGIDHPALLQELRRRLAATEPDPAARAFAALARHPWLFDGLAAVARTVDPRLTKTAALAPDSPVGRFLRGRRFPGLARPFARRFRKMGQGGKS
ncbi:lactate utilization protein B [Solidesulfovibrio sp.]|uniref:LUD domain-containing protein n=1 Tax=Solidesulfovibrio sp. TaxID=2910990 RepID=UPI00262AEDCC|nr:lactate utilization protein B [Solidesulfovibrio sp.]